MDQSTLSNKQKINNNNINNNSITPPADLTTSSFYSIIKNSFLIKKIFNEQRKDRLVRWAYTPLVSDSNARKKKPISKWRYQDWCDLEEMCKNGYHHLLYDKVVRKDCESFQVTENGVLLLCETLTDYSMFEAIYRRRRDWFVGRLVLAKACKGGNIKIIKLLLDQSEPCVLPRDLAIELAAEGGRLEVVQYLFQEIGSPKIDPFYAFHGALLHPNQTDIYEYLRKKLPDDAFQSFIQLSNTRSGDKEYFELICGDTKVVEQVGNTNHPMQQFVHYLGNYRHKHPPTTQYKMIQVLLDRLDFSKTITEEEYNAAKAIPFPPTIYPKGFNFTHVNDQIMYYILEIVKATHLNNASTFDNLADYSTDFLCYLSKSHDFSMFARYCTFDQVVAVHNYLLKQSSDADPIDQRSLLRAYYESVDRLDDISEFLLQQHPILYKETISTRGLDGHHHTYYGNERLKKLGVNQPSIKISSTYNLDHRQVEAFLETSSAKQEFTDYPLTFIVRLDDIILTKKLLKHCFVGRDKSEQLSICHQLLNVAFYHGSSQIVNMLFNDGYVQPCPLTKVRITKESIDSVGQLGDLNILNHLISVTSIETARTYALSSACRYGNLSLVGRLLPPLSDQDVYSTTLECQKESVVYNQFEILDYFYQNEIYVNKIHFIKEILKYAYQCRNVPTLKWAFSKIEKDEFNSAGNGGLRNSGGARNIRTSGGGSGSGQSSPSPSSPGLSFQSFFFSFVTSHISVLTENYCTHSIIIYYLKSIHFPLSQIEGLLNK